jgi:Flp pilus assembly pilin Flp
MFKKLLRLLTDERGEDFIEYALLTSLIAVLLVTVLTNLKDAIVGVFNEVITALGGTP